MKVNIDVRKVKDNGPKLRDAIMQLVGKEVLVGYPEEKDTPRKDIEKTVGRGKKKKTVTTKAGKLNNATIAYILDHGSPAHNIPPRPFLEPGVALAGAKIERQLKRTARDAMEMGPAAAEAGLTGVGVDAVSGVRRYITTGPFQELSDVTLRRRQAKGFRGTKPLIMTGQLRAAVNFTVRNKRSTKMIPVI